MEKHGKSAKVLQSCKVNGKLWKTCGKSKRSPSFEVALQPLVPKRQGLRGGHGRLRVAIMSKASIRKPTFISMNFSSY